MRVSKRCKIILGIAVSLAVTGLGLLALPEVVRRIATSQLDEVVAAPISIADIDLNLFTGDATISNLMIGGSQKDRPLLRLPSAVVNFSTLALLRGVIRLENLVLIRPELFLARTGPASFNVTEILQLPAGRRDEGPALDFTIEQSAIQNATIAFVDRSVSPEFQQTFKNVTLKAGSISTVPELSLTPTSFELRLNIADGSITMTGEATPIARPVGIEVAASWQNLDPAMFQAYLPARPVIDLNDSRSSGEMRYVLLHGENKAQYLTASLNTGPVKIYSPEAQEPVLTVAGLIAANLRWDFITNQGRLGELVMREPEALLERDANGEFTLVRLFEGGDSIGSAAGEAKEEKAGVPFVIDALRTERGTIELRDHAVSPAVTAVFNDLRLSLEGLSLAHAGPPGHFSAEARIGESPVRINGSLQADPFWSLLQISADNLPLAVYEGYLRLIWGILDQWRGRLNGNVELALATGKQGLEVKLSGRLDARKVTLGLRGSHEPRLQAERLSLDIAALRSHPFWLDLRRLQLEEANFHVRRDRNGRFNLRRVWATENEPIEGSRQKNRAESMTAQKDASDPPFVIRSTVVKNSSVQFVDAAVQPAFDTRLTEVGLELGKLGRQSGFTPVSFQAILEDSAKLELKGSVKFFETPVQIKLAGVLRDYDLANLNPYATKFISYEIERGRVTTDVEYAYDAGDLEGENEIAIRQLRLGKRTGDDFEEKIGISLRLAIALLQSADGSIRLTVPVSGNVDDPQFDFGAIIWRAVRNAVIKFISAPLRLLGKVVTLGGRITQIRIDPVEFEPGSLDLAERGEKQLKQLSEFLKNKPRLDLELRGLAAAEELDELKRQRLRRQLRDSGENYEAAIARLYRLAAKQRQNSGSLPSIGEMEDYLAERVVLSQEALQELAKKRASRAEQLLTELGVDSGRLYTGDIQVQQDLPGRVEFEILS